MLDFKPNRSEIVVHQAQAAIFIDDGRVMASRCPGCLPARKSLN
jgi:hypothetical protein